MVLNRSLIFAVITLLTGLFVTSSLSGQEASSWQIKGKPLIGLNRALPGPGNTQYPLSGVYRIFPRKAALPAVKPVIYEPSVTAKGFSPADLALFCRLEYKMERAFRFPVKIRLGEVQYVEEMEGKINSMKINPSHRVYGPR